MFREIGKSLEGIQNVTCGLNMFSIGNPSNHTINEELLSAYDMNMLLIKEWQKLELKFVPNHMMHH